MKRERRVVGDDHPSPPKSPLQMSDYRHLFGPVPSRRLGRSLGVDLTPHKTCTLDCRFCQLGPTTNLALQRKDYVPVAEVEAELLHWRDQGGQADWITLSGSGEPTLHAHFGRILEFIKRRMPFPAALLSNGTLFYRPAVRRAALAARLVKVTLSAWDATSFRDIHQPNPSLCFSRQVEGLRKFRAMYSGALWVEVFLIAGRNDADWQIEKIAALAQTLTPDAVHLNTAVRPPADRSIKPVSRERLEEVAGLFAPRATVIAEFPLGHAPDFEVNETRILDMLRRRPCTARQVAEVFGLHLNEVAKYIGDLVRQGNIEAADTLDEHYYKASHPGPIS